MADASAYRVLAAKSLQAQDEPHKQSGVGTAIKTGGTLLGTLVGAYFGNPAVGAAVGQAAGGLGAELVDPSDPSASIEDRLAAAAKEEGLGLFKTVGPALASKGGK